MWSSLLKVCIGFENKDIELVSLLLPVRTILQLILPPGVELELELVYDAIDHVPLDHHVDDLGVLPLFFGLARLQCWLLPAVISAIIEE